MECAKCGSRNISWEIDAGFVVITYNVQGEEIDRDFKCDSLNSPQCVDCNSVDIIEIEKSEFGPNTTVETMNKVRENILNRYCNPEYFSPEELELISNNEFCT